MASSRVFGLVDGAAARIRRAAETSATVAAANRSRDGWRLLGWPVRRLLAGTVLLIGTAVHVGLTGWQTAPPGWLWLIVPGIAATCGLLLVAASGPAIGSTRGR